MDAAAGGRAEVGVFSRARRPTGGCAVADARRVPDPASELRACAGAGPRHPSAAVEGASARESSPAIPRRGAGVRPHPAASADAAAGDARRGRAGPFLLPEGPVRVDRLRVHHPHAGRRRAVRRPGPVAVPGPASAPLPASVRPARNVNACPWRQPRQRHRLFRPAVAGRASRQPCPWRAVPPRAERPPSARPGSRRRRLTVCPGPCARQWRGGCGGRPRAARPRCACPSRGPCSERPGRARGTGDRRRWPR